MRLKEFDVESSRIKSIILVMICMIPIHFGGNSYGVYLSLSLSVSIMNWISSGFLAIAITHVLDKRILSLFSLMLYELSCQLISEETIFNSFYILVITVAILWHLSIINRETRDGDYSLGYNFDERLTNLICHDFQMVKPPIFFRIITYIFMIQAYMITNGMIESFSTEVDVSSVNLAGSIIYIFALLMMVIDVPDALFLWGMIFVNTAAAAISTTKIQTGLLVTTIMEQLVYMVCILVSMEVYFLKNRDCKVTISNNT